LSWVFLDGALVPFLLSISAVPPLCYCEITSSLNPPVLPHPCIAREDGEMIFKLFFVFLLLLPKFLNSSWALLLFHPPSRDVAYTAGSTLMVLLLSGCFTCQVGTLGVFPRLLPSPFLCLDFYTFQAILFSTHPLNCLCI